MRKASGSLCQLLHKIDVSIRANLVFSRYGTSTETRATSSNTTHEYFHGVHIQR